MQRFLQFIKEPFYRNSLAILGNSFSSAFYGLVFWIVAAHMLRSDDLGLAIATISAATLLTSLSRFGMDDVLVRFLPGSKDKPVLYSSILLVTLLLAIIMTVGFLCLVDYLSPSLSYLRNGWYLLLFLFYMVTISIYTTQNTTLLAIRRADLSFVQNSLLGMRILLLFAIASLGAIGILLSFNVAYLAALLLGLVYLAKQGFTLRPGGVKTVIKIVRDHLGYSTGNYVSVIFTILPSTLIPIIIINTIGAENVAYFYIAYSIAALLFIIPNAISMSLFIEGSHDMPMNEYSLKSMKMIFLIIIPLIVVLLLFGDKLLLLFNKEYSQQSIDLLKLLIMSGLFSSIISVYSSIRRVEKNVKSLNKVSIASSIMIVGLGYVFMTMYGLIGLGYAWLASNAILAVFLIAILVKEGKIIRARSI